MTFDYDLVTIGAGSGGVAASRRAAALGARVAIVEGRRVGGTCVLRGCVPKKLLSYAAHIKDEVDIARGFGWTIAEPHFDMARFAVAKANETTRLEGVYRSMLATAGVTVVDGYARVERAHEVLVDGRVLTAGHVLLATGAAPVRDSIPGIELCAVSDDLLDLTTLPQAAAMIGAGYVAVEFASMFARLGVRVSLFFREHLPLRGFDEMLRQAAAASLTAAGVTLHPGCAPRVIEQVAGGLLLQGSDGVDRTFPWVLNATGRRPITKGLNVALTTSGAVQVDEHLATSLPGVWAVGDVTNRKNLTPVAIAEGRALADSLFGPSPRTVDLRQVASAVFLEPPLGSVGPTEDEAVAAGRDIKVFEASFRPMKIAFVGGQERTQMKLLVDAETDKVLAVHMSGTDAPEIVQSLAVALTAGATKADFDRTLAVHPTAAEEFVLMREPTRVLRAVPPPEREDSDRKAG